VEPARETHLNDLARTTKDPTHKQGRVFCCPGEIVQMCLARWFHSSTSASFTTIATPSTHASVPWPAAESAITPRAKTTHAMAVRGATGKVNTARGATNKPQITIATAGAPSPSRIVPTVPVPLLKPQYDSAAIAHNSTRKLKAMLADFNAIVINVIINKTSYEKERNARRDIRTERSPLGTCGRDR